MGNNLPLELDPAPATCAYCQIKFERTPVLFLTKCLNRGEKHLDFCCLDHRRQMITTHVVHEDRNLVFNPDLHSPHVPATFFDDDPMPEVCPVEGLTPEQVFRLRSFFENWLRLSPAQRDVTARLLCGANGREVAKARKVSPQAVSKRLKDARGKHSIVAKVLPPPEGGRSGPPGDLPDLRPSAPLLDMVDSIVPDRRKPND